MKNYIALLAFAVLLTACTARNRVENNVYTTKNPQLELKVSDEFQHLGNKLITVHGNYGGSANYSCYYDADMFVKINPDGSVASIACVFGWEPTDVRFYLDIGIIESLTSYYKKHETLGETDFKSIVLSRHKDSLEHLKPLMKKWDLAIPDEYLGKLYYKLHSKRGGIFVFYLEPKEPGTVPTVGKLTPQDKKRLAVFEQRVNQAFSDS